MSFSTFGNLEQGKIAIFSRFVWVPDFFYINCPTVFLRTNTAQNHIYGQPR